VLINELFEANSITEITYQEYNMENQNSQMQAKIERTDPDEKVAPFI
jgi:hypothetical protein